MIRDNSTARLDLEIRALPCLLVLAVCLVWSVSGCALAPRDEEPREIQGPEQAGSEPVATSGEDRPTSEEPGDAPLEVPEPAETGLAVIAIPEPAREPVGVGVPAPPEPNDAARPSRNARTVEERIEAALAEIQGEQKQAADAENQLMQEITGLIVEETMTKIGYEFYEYFFLRWEPPVVQMKDYNILITEKATPTWGSLVEVKIGETPVFGRMLRPRSEDIEEAAKEAIAATRQYLENYEKEQLQTPDLMTSGI